eukprot:CAMPEP_0180825054 /NCGR_PEP_ID=MMETSP1038_2-20121128/72760_1 /TAXON_ID=632150 /ORGANISM="Azadinium spinosum, Strain 3D9" /LENGTH=928 /DNA_ID=CAMNT_0022867479 /DNA_START=76 /DNA_END=2863 /DNA_ORIENTATION=+
MPEFSVGALVVYYSSSKRRWLESTIEAASPTGEVQVACKPGYWMPLAEQGNKLRLRRPSCAVMAEESKSSLAAWSVERSLRIGALGEEHLFKGRVTVLDRALVRSVHDAVQQLCRGTIACSEGFCVVYSESSMGYYLLYRCECKDQAMTRLSGVTLYVGGVKDAAVADHARKRDGCSAVAGSAPVPSALGADAASSRPAVATAEVATSGQGSSGKRDAAGGSLEALRLPSQSELEDLSADPREAFNTLRIWLKAYQHRPEALAAAAQSLDAAHRRSIFAFLCSVPSRKPLFASQARELLKLIAEQPSWCRDGVTGEADLQAALAQRPAQLVKAPETHGTSGRRPSQVATPPGVQVFAPAARVPSPVPETEKAEEKEEEPSRNLLSGLPPLDAFQERSRHDAADTFKDLRKWARQLAVWDLAVAGRQLDASTRKSIFRLITKICGRRLYRLQGREMLSMLLSIKEWTDGDAVDEASVEKCLELQPRAIADSQAGAGPVAGGAAPARTSTLCRPCFANTGALAAARGAPSIADSVAPAAAGLVGGLHNAGALGPRKTRQTCGAWARPPSAIGRCSGHWGASGVMSGKDLVRLYKASGIGGEAALSAQGADGQTLRLLLALAGQRLRDLFVDPLRKLSGRTKVHLPHLYIDLQPRTVYIMPGHIQAVVEEKIRRSEKWTPMEKAHVLCARHEYTLRYVLAYSLARARITGRGMAVWIPMGMNTAAQGHANAVVFQSVDGAGTMRVLVYDPNFDVSRDHWVHARKAVNDALPEVRRLLEGTGITVTGQAELFGHGLQTALGTTERHQGWFSKKEYTTQRGYPICGAVVFLLASNWLAVAQGTGGALDDVMDVEGALSEVVADSAGKIAVQGRIAKILQDLIDLYSDSSAEPLAASMRRRLDADRAHWPAEVVKSGGSMKLALAQRPEFVYRW